ncbi:ATP-dependent DNA ligase [Candidatus Woesearchaeota archaeon]|nr:ATP-dependent DNA ligase [Candidatus Woesearchaeota archaeon]
MKFLDLVKVYEQLEATSSGNKLREILSDFFKKVPKQEIEKVTYMTLGTIASDFEDINLGMADKMVVRAIANAVGKDNAEVKQIFKAEGDVGKTAEKTVAGKTAKLQIDEVFNGLHKIASASGSGSQDVKVTTLANLLKKATPKEARYLARIVLGTLRMGVGDMTVLDALSITFTGTKANKPRLEHAFNICPDVGIIAKTIASKGLKGIDKIGVAVGRPIKMMLAQRVTDIETIKEKMPSGIAAEEKYDGERIQAHFSKGKLVLFSRRMEDITNQFPDVCKQIKANLKAKEFVVEGEAVAIDEKGNLLPFQRLMQRRRKYDVEAYVKKIPVCIYLFDLLYLNSRSYIREDYPKRHKALEKIAKKETKNLQIAKRIVCDDIECIEEFFNKSLQRGCEGIIAKSTAGDSVYKTGMRGWLWIKWKREYSTELADTFDLVVVGAFAGRGRRAGTYGALLCAAYNKKTDSFETVCKLGSGFTDEHLAKLPKRFKKYLMNKKPARAVINKAMKPDYWFEPKIVVEVLGAELTRSPIHSCSEKQGKGLALRFPRFKRYREDKKPEQATTTKEILALYGKKR